jgi:hypothetical protein
LQQLRSSQIFNYFESVIKVLFANSSHSYTDLQDKKTKNTTLGSWKIVHQEYDQINAVFVDLRNDFQIWALLVQKPKIASR